MSRHKGRRMFQLKLKRVAGPRKILALSTMLLLLSSALVGLAGSASATDATYATVTGHAPFSEDANHPDYWGDNCTEGGGADGDSYVLPAGTYTKVIVKAGSGEFANTIFAAPPKAGETVWADTNGNNVFDPGGQDGDKQISHTILCEGTPPPPDVCPNINGYQSEIPAGMVKNEAGDCVTPPPPPTDVCPNIPGNQDQVPRGLVKDNDGNCVVQPSPPTDVCPNINGYQSSVPAGYTQTNDGKCIKPVVPSPHPRPPHNPPAVADTSVDNASSGFSPLLPIGAGFAAMLTLAGAVLRRRSRRGQEL
jgi:hypothetical protein